MPAIYGHLDLQKWIVLYFGHCMMICNCVWQYLLWGKISIKYMGSVPWYTKKEYTMLLPGCLQWSENLRILTTVFLEFVWRFWCIQYLLVCYTIHKCTYSEIPRMNLHISHLFRYSYKLSKICEYWFCFFSFFLLFFFFLFYIVWRFGEVTYLEENSSIQCITMPWNSKKEFRP